jgi:ATPase subunit of ABC transporter with duplicated ATPase domains
MIQRAARARRDRGAQLPPLLPLQWRRSLAPSAALSYGERARLELALLVAQGCNFLLLDEPINHLDIPARSRFEEALAQFEGTTLAVVHDRYFIDRFATERCRRGRRDNSGLAPTMAAHLNPTM